MNRQASFKERARKRRVHNLSKYQTSRRRRCKNAIPKSLSIYGSYISPHMYGIAGNSNFNGMTFPPRMNYMPMYNPEQSYHYPHYGSINGPTSTNSHSISSVYSKQLHLRTGSYGGNDEQGRGSAKRPKYESESSSLYEYDDAAALENNSNVVNTPKKTFSTPEEAEKLKALCLAIATSASHNLKSVEGQIYVEDVDWFSVGKQVGLDGQKCKQFWVQEGNNHLYKKFPLGIMLYCGKT